MAREKALGIVPAGLAAMMPQWPFQLTGDLFLPGPGILAALTSFLGSSSPLGPLPHLLFLFLCCPDSTLASGTNLLAALGRDSDSFLDVGSLAGTVSQSYCLSFQM